MNLKKDALVAVSLAGAVLLMAAFSTQIGKPDYEDTGKPAEPVLHDRELFYLFAKFSGLNSASSELDRRQMSAARKEAIRIYFTKQLRAPMDYFRLASILKSSSDPKELALAHRLAVEALGAGVQRAQKTVFEAQDRLLLSKGKGQRYGTQVSWNGKPLDSYGTPSDDAALIIKQRAMIPNEPIAAGTSTPGSG